MTGDSVVSDYGTGCYRLDDEETVENGGRVDEVGESSDGADAT